jgi:hypothetical protein
VATAASVFAVADPINYVSVKAVFMSVLLLHDQALIKTCCDAKKS